MTDFEGRTPDPASPGFFAFNATEEGPAAFVFDARGAPADYDTTCVHCGAHTACRCPSCFLSNLCVCVCGTPSAHVDPGRSFEYHVCERHFSRADLVIPIESLSHSENLERVEILTLEKPRLQTSLCCVRARCALLTADERMELRTRASQAVAVNASSLFPSACFDQSWFQVNDSYMVIRSPGSQPELPCSPTCMCVQ